MAKYKIKLNDAPNLRDLLQETYMLADSQLVQSQNEINKLANATDLTDETMDGKQRYAKAINDYLNIKDRAIRTKLDIAKLMSEIIEHNGDVKKALESDQSNMATFDINKIRKMVNESYEDNDKTKTIEIRK